MRRALAGLRQVVLQGDPIAPYLAEQFHPRPIDAEASVTGYYEPVLEGRRTRQGRFVYPIYRRPADLVEVHLSSLDPGARNLFGSVSHGQLEPYLTRKRIDGDGMLDGRGLEIAWLADPVDRFFLHIQGSGVIRLGNGLDLRVGYASSNGRPYTSIGRLLLDRGVLEPGEASTPGIQRWLRSHPEVRDEVLHQNERYIFFREAPDGPFGSLGVQLTAGRSVAVDWRVHPGVTLLWLDTRLPEVDADGSVTSYRPLRRLLLAQDAGAAIIGPARIDLFLGTGFEAGQIAGNLKEAGQLWALSPCADA